MQEKAGKCGEKQEKVVKKWLKIRKNQGKMALCACLRVICVAFLCRMFGFLYLLFWFLLSVLIGNVCVCECIYCEGVLGLWFLCVAGMGFFRLWLKVVHIDIVYKVWFEY